MVAVIALCLGYFVCDGPFHIVIHTFHTSTHSRHIVRTVSTLMHLYLTTNNKLDNSFATVFAVHAVTLSFCSRFVFQHALRCNCTYHSIACCCKCEFGRACHGGRFFMVCKFIWISVRCTEKKREKQDTQHIPR